MELDYTESLFLLCAATAAFSFFWLVLGFIADYIVDPIVKRLRK